MHEEVSRFHVSNGIWDIILDLSNDVRKTFFENSNRGFGIRRLFTLRVSYLEI